MRARVLELLGIVLIAGSLLWLVLALRDHAHEGGLTLRTWLPAPTSTPVR